MPRATLNADFIKFPRVRLDEAGADVRRIFRDGVLQRSPTDNPKRPDRIQFSLI